LINNYILLGIFILLAAFFSGLEGALLYLTDLKIKKLESSGVKGMGVILKLRENPQKLHISILICARFFIICSASMASYIALIEFEKLQISHFISISLIVSTCIITFIVLMFVEIIPKSFFIKRSENIVFRIAGFIKFITILFYPVYIIIAFLRKLIAKDYFMFEKPVLTEDEIKSMIEDSRNYNSIDEEEKELIHNVLDLDKTEAKEIMTPRVDMFCLDLNNKISDVIDEIIEKGFSRIPVFEKRVDRIKGIVFIKDIMAQLVKGKNDIKLKDIMKPVIYVPENKMINSILTRFKKEKVHLAMVVDEYGGIEGLVTIEDVLEELVGEIYDETDEPEKLIKKTDNNSVQVLGKVNIEDINEELDLNLEESEAYETISGFILFKLGKIPAEEEELIIDKVKMKVKKVIDNRIKEIEITKMNQ